MAIDPGVFDEWEQMERLLVGSYRLIAPQRQQVTLRGLFLCTAYFGLSSALATRFGLGLFVLLNGVFLTWLSFRGYLWWMQTNRARPKVFGLAWLTVAVSLALPAFAIPGCGTAPPKVHAGWEAAWMTAGTALEAWEESGSWWNDPTQHWITEGGALLGQWMIVVIWNLPNLLMLASPLLLWRQQRGNGQILSALFGCAAFSSWTWGMTSEPGLRIGYYVWSAGITGIALARPPGWRTLMAMAALGGLWLALVLWGQL